MLNWSEEIEKLLLVNGWTGAHLARDLGVSTAYISSVGRGGQLPSEKVKMGVWERLGYALDRDALLAFFPLHVAEELLELERTGGPRVADQSYSGTETKDWVEDLVALMKERGLRHGKFAQEIGAHSSYLSNVIHGKNAITWPIKIAVWNLRKYDLSINSIMNLLPAEVTLELRKYEIDYSGKAKRVLKPQKQEEPVNRITDRITQPSPQEVHAARLNAGLTQEQAAVLISTAQVKPYKTWQPYEVPEGQSGCRAIPLAAWELFLLMTDQHPLFVLGERKGPVTLRATGDKKPEVNPNQLGLPL